MSRVVPLEGVEPTHRKILDSKSSASTNSAIRAYTHEFKGLMVAHPLSRYV
jgi:hypothetical protein